MPEETTPEAQDPQPAMADEVTSFAAASEIAPAAPVGGGERIVAIDVLRGVALLGILVMNIKAFSMISAAYMNPMAAGPLEGVNRWVWLLEHHFFDMKMMNIFSMLFGAGVVLMTSRADARGGHSAGVHYRRMAWLILFGLLHAHLLWWGDILYAYGMCGLVLYLFRKLGPVVLIVLAMAAMLIGTALMMGIGLTMPYWPEEQLAKQMASWAPDADAIASEIAAYRGGWLDQAGHRTPHALGFETFGMIFFGWRIGGNMLLGMALFKLGVFSAARSTRFYATLVALGAVVGLPLISMGVRANEASGWSMADGMFVNGQFNYWASLLVSLGWIGLVMLVVKAGALAWLTRRLAAVGQMAFTNYIMHSVICTLIFYGHGLGAFAKLDRWEQQLVVLAIWALQLSISLPWLARFRFGPLEWLWRSLTYWKLQPMKR